ncbi:alpha/beta-hydrolase [Heliocybe sulcata]|uniref:1-alkyl-2-acetylglycerophosphocholine esterase n=1 Tax=Heliocybe sulcata TaxID=5364 RepID=A0A5C3MK60_9AGAM|nr:alpha/beta-hydrolase [Heliocybe sulcata]
MAKVQSTKSTFLKEQDPESPRLHQVPRKSPFGALLSRTLPEYSGPHAVGVCDIEVPLPRQTFGNFKHKSLPGSGNVGLVMDTVLFSLFYPCEKPAKPTPTAWFPSLRQTIDGFLKMAKRTPNFWYRVVAYPAAAAAVSGTTFPANKEAPLLIPNDSSGKKWPVMIFSHGAGCSRLMYSAFCGEMASRGYVVAAIEHRDGTSPSSKITAADGTTKVLDWLEWSDLEWPDAGANGQPKDDTALRHVQIQLRCAEVKEVLGILDKLSKGEDVLRTSLHAPDFEWKRWEHVDPSKPVMVGHSLGGSVGLATSSQHMPFRAVVVFDPATQRLDPWRANIPHPLLVVNSEEFAVGKEYAIFAEQIAGTTAREHDEHEQPAVFTIPGATHPSFSDVFLILPEYINKMTGLRVRADKVLELAVDATTDFLNGRVDRVIKRAVRYEGDGDGHPSLRVEGREEEADGGGEECMTVAKPKRPVGQPGELVWNPFCG